MKRPAMTIQIELDEPSAPLSMDHVGLVRFFVPFKNTFSLEWFDEMGNQVGQVRLPDGYSYRIEGRLEDEEW